MIKKILGLLLIFVGIWGSGLFLHSRFFAQSARETEGITKSIKLPLPKYKGKVSVEEAIFKRKSIRHYKDEPLTLEDISQLLWAAGGKTIDGVTGATRAYPSAGGIYPLEIYLVVGNVTGLSKGIYRYQWDNHTITLLKEGDFRQQLMQGALGQQMVADAPVNLAFTACYSRTVNRYGQRGEIRYVSMDVGGAGQNIHLQAEALGLGTVIVGAFKNEAVKNVLGVKNEEPLYIMPVGKK